MPCIFCIAMFALVAGTITTTLLDRLEARFRDEAASPVRRSVDSSSVTKLEFSMALPAARRGDARPPVPVALTIYKAQKRVRIQILSHELTRAEAEALEDRIAGIAEVQIVGRSDEKSEAKVREAMSASAAQPSPGGQTIPVIDQER